MHRWRPALLSLTRDAIVNAVDEDGVVSGVAAGVLVYAFSSRSSNLPPVEDSRLPSRFELCWTCERVAYHPISSLDSHPLGYIKRNQVSSRVYPLNNRALTPCIPSAAHSTRIPTMETTDKTYFELAKRVSMEGSIRQCSCHS